MMESQLRDLLHKLNGGEEQAAERLFWDYATRFRSDSLRKVRERGENRPNFEIILKEVWEDVLCVSQEAGWRFGNAEHLKTFLAKMIQERMAKEGREKSSGVREQRTGTRPGVFWGQTVAGTPSPRRDILRLKMRGFSSSDIAATLGLSEIDVRAVLHEVAKESAARRAGEERLIASAD